MMTDADDDDDDDEFSDPQSWERLRELVRRRNPYVDVKTDPNSLRFLHLVDTLRRLVYDKRKINSFFGQLKRGITWH